MKCQAKPLSLGQCKWCCIHVFVFFTWYVLSKVSYINRVIKDVLPTRCRWEERKKKKKFAHMSKCQTHNLLSQKTNHTPYFPVFISNLPLCSPRKHNLYFRRGLLNSGLVISYTVIKRKKKKKKVVNKSEFHIKNRKVFVLEPEFQNGWGFLFYYFSHINSC